MLLVIFPKLADHAANSFQMHRLDVSLKQGPSRSDINIGTGIRRNLRQFIVGSVKSEPRRIAIVSNKRVFALYGAEIVRNLKGAGFKVYPWLMPEGERYKSFRVLEGVVK